MRQLAIALICFLCGVLPATTQADSFFEIDRVDLADVDVLDANEIGRFGRLQALTGETLLVAAPVKEDSNDGGSVDGNVYSFQLQPDSTLLFQQKIGPAARFGFGTTLAADGDWAAIGENSARVHIYQRSGANWNPTQLLQINPDVPATPGITVRNLNSRAAMDGNLLAIGNNDANVTVGEEIVNNAGAVVLFRRGVNSAWVHEATLVSPQPVGTSEFGAALALSGDTLLVGADNDLDGAVRRGRAFVFQRTLGQWAWVATLTIPDAAGTTFGWSVALDGDVAIVGCGTCNISEDGPSNAGSFFAFERNLGGVNNWGLRGEFVGSTPEFIDRFSFSLKLAGNTLLVGSPGSKRAYFFFRSATGNWQEVELLASANPNNTDFGTSVEFIGGRATIGAEQFPDTSGSQRWGAVHSWFSPSVESCDGNFDAIFCDGFEVQD